MVYVTEMSTLGCLLCHTTETKTATHPYTPHCERSKGEDGRYNNYRDSPSH